MHTYCCKSGCNVQHGKHRLHLNASNLQHSLTRWVSHVQSSCTMPSAKVAHVTAKMHTCTHAYMFRCPAKQVNNVLIIPKQNKPLCCSLRSPHSGPPLLHTLHTVHICCIHVQICAFLCNITMSSMHSTQYFYKR